MKLADLALDYDGTIAVDGILDNGVRAAIAEARQRRIAVLLVTGRRLTDLRTVVGDLSFDVVVAENGGVLEFPATSATSSSVIRRRTRSSTNCGGAASPSQPVRPCSRRTAQPRRLRSTCCASWSSRSFSRSTADA